MDDIDIAQQREQWDRELALKARGQRQDETPNYDETGKRLCLDCDMRIPTRRLQAVPNAVRCIDCQQLHEQRNR